MKFFILLFSILIPLAGLAQESTVRIKITGDKLEKIYTVRFASMDTRDIKVTVLDVQGTPFYFDSLSSTSFVKHYDLSKLPNGLYSFRIVYGTESYSEDVFLQSKKELMKQSVVVQKEIDKIKVSMAEYNTEPVSVFFVKPDGSSAGYDYIDNQAIKEKQYTLSKFAGATMIEVVQNGEVMVREML